MITILKISKANIWLLPKHYKSKIVYYERADVVFQICFGNT